MNVAYLKVKQAIGSSFFFSWLQFLMSFHRHSCQSIMIICIQPRAVAGADAGMARHVFFFLSNWDGAPLGVGALCKLCTLRIGSGGTACHVVTKSLSRKVHSLGLHICNASGQLKQDQVLSKWMGESWYLKNCSLNSRLNYIFQISDKIWNELTHECSYAQIAFKKLLFQARPADA